MGLLNVGDWVVTPEGIGRVGQTTEGNAFVWVGMNVYAFALHLVTPLDKPVADILNITKE